MIFTLAEATSFYYTGNGKQQTAQDKQFAQNRAQDAANQGLKGGKQQVNCTGHKFSRSSNGTYTCINCGGVFDSKGRFLGTTIPSGLDDKGTENMWKAWTALAVGLSAGTCSWAVGAFGIGGAATTATASAPAAQKAADIFGNASFAQSTYSSSFSAEGSSIYSNLAGKNINTISDLANALKAGNITPSQLPIDYIVRDGNTLILNTRTAQALIQAGISENAWAGVDRTGEWAYETMLSNQLANNGLTSFGTKVVTLTGYK